MEIEGFRVCRVLVFKNMNKTSLFIIRIIGTAVDGLNSWSRQQIIDTVKPIVGFYCNQTNLLKKNKHQISIQSFKIFFSHGPGFSFW